MGTRMSNTSQQTETIQEPYYNSYNNYNQYQPQYNYQYPQNNIPNIYNQQQVVPGELQYPTPYQIRRQIFVKGDK
jgi:hypothetical protein